MFKKPSFKHYFLINFLIQLFKIIESIQNYNSTIESFKLNIKIDENPKKNHVKNTIKK